jgi:hypothetical protein
MNQIKNMMMQLSSYNPSMSVDPVRGMNQEIGTKLGVVMNQGVKANQGQMSQGPRKKSMYYQEDETQDEVANDLIEQLKKSFNVINTVTGDNVHINQEMKQFNDLIRRLALSNNIQGVHVTTDQNIKEINGHHGFSEEQLKQIARRLAIINKLKGNHVQTNQKVVEINGHAHKNIVENDDTMNDVLQTLQKLAIKNVIQGNTVHTHQDVKEFNDDLGYDVSKTLQKLAMSNNIQGVKVNTNQDIKEYNDDTLNDITRLLQRLAIKNDIKGNTVHTHQDVKEFNNNDRYHDLMRTLQRLAVSNDIKGIKVDTKQDITEFNNDLYRNLVDYLGKSRRLAVSNNIKGIDVITNQDVKEINNDPIEEITKSLQRLAIQNNIQGETVKTDQNIQELNDEVDSGKRQSSDDQTKAILSALQRLALSNNIKGNTVVTDQNVKEYNDEDAVLKDQKRTEASDDDHQGESEDEMVQKSEDNEQPLFSQDDFVGPVSPVVPVNPVGLVGSQPHLLNLQDQLSIQRYNDILKRVTLQNSFPQIYPQQVYPADNPRRYYDESEDEKVVDDKVDNDHSDDHSYDYKSDADELKSDEHKSFDKESDDGLVDFPKQTRRMTINNNLSEARKMSVANKIEGNKVKTTQNLVEVKRTPMVISTPDVKMVIAATGPGVTPRPNKKTKGPLKPQAAAASKRPVLECKTADGKKIYEADLNKFIKLLGDLNNVEKASEEKKTRK